jgi:high-affinity iron transporter
MDWLPPLLDPVWDTSAVLNDSSGVGRMLAEFLGYRARPCATLLLVYLAFWTVVVLTLRPTRGGQTVGHPA